MKSFLLTLLFLSVIVIGNAQIIDIPDVNFKEDLINNGVDTNNDGEIQITEAESVTNLFLSNDAVILEGLQHFTNLEDLRLYFLLNLETLDLTPLTNLQSFEISACPVLQNINLVGLTSLQSLILAIEFDTLDISGLINLEYLDITLSSALANLDFPSLTNLTTLIAQFNFNNNDNLDLSQNFNLTTLDVSNSYLETLTIKNGSTENLNIENCDNLQFICVDDDEIGYVQSLVENSGLTNCVVNSYCTFDSGGITYDMEGESLLDVDDNGCDLNDIQFPNLILNISSDTNSGSFIANTSGDYSFDLPDGAHTITSQLQNPDYFSITPTSFVVDFPNDSSPYTQDFCLTPNGVYNDLEVVILPLHPAIPGFDASYKIIYNNKGNTTLSGSLEFDYDLNSDYIQYDSSFPIFDSETNNILTWNFTDLTPFETREIVITFNLNTPTDPMFPLNNGDELGYVTNIFPFIGDESQSDNRFELKQIVVNSFDPNDIRCLEGESILPENVGKYVHYLIRFENLGTANAINIVVNNAIDVTKFDINTLVPIDGSHDYVTRINPDNDVEFIFENIQLPFDDTNNDGYVLYKIKTLQSLVLGDEFSNLAEIFFDFNAPIITNTYTTEVAEDNLGTSDFSLSKIKVYPNPVSNALNIETNYTIDAIRVYDIKGRKVLEVNQDQTIQIDMSSLKSGVYIMKVISYANTETFKVIKQ